MAKLLKHRLPSCSVLSHLCLDEQTLIELQSCMMVLKNEFISVFDVNKELCGIHHSLASQVYDNFFQIALTDSEAVNNAPDISCEKIASELYKGSISQSVRRKKAISTTSNSPFNELSYTKKTETYNRYQTLFDKIFLTFKSQPTRIRLVRLAAGAIVPPHIDYDPSYAVRIIIPIISNPECLNLFWVKNNSETFYLRPGQAYFLNTGYRHAVVNLSHSDRYTLMVTLSGTEDINQLFFDADYANI